MPFDSLSVSASGAVAGHRRCSHGSLSRRVGDRLRPEAVARLVGGFVRNVAGTLVAWRERARARRVLAAMDERMRRDIGLSQFHVLRESTKPFWRA